MDLKFYLNKFLKVDRIEDYTLNTLIKLKDNYEKFKKTIISYIPKMMANSERKEELMKYVKGFE